MLSGISDCHSARVVLLLAIMLIVIMLCAIQLSVILLSDILSLCSAYHHFTEKSAFCSLPFW
jgi:hypothetical protein